MTVPHIRIITLNAVVTEGSSLLYVLLASISVNRWNADSSYSCTYDVEEVCTFVDLFLFIFDYFYFCIEIASIDGSIMLHRQTHVAVVYRLAVQVCIGVDLSIVCCEISGVETLCGHISQTGSVSWYSLSIKSYYCIIQSSHASLKVLEFYFMTTISYPRFFIL